MDGKHAITPMDTTSSGSLRVENIVAKDEMAIIVDSPADSPAAEHSPILNPMVLMNLNRKYIIRGILSRIGVPIAAETEYFQLFSDYGNLKLDSVWNNWAAWCIQRNLDPAKRSDKNLTSFISNSHKSRDWRVKVRIATNTVWAQVEELP
ncbi:hypothetical protein FBU31_000950 [Coemansia sp. 'formosensis']|nr:hypothetical protein FBU31_000950 [Coemansia sp. 'formosensis']